MKTIDRNLLEKKIDDIIDTETFFFGLPVISKGKDWVRVNNLVIREENNLFTIRQMGYLIAEFSYRSWAVAYAISLIRMDRKKCDYLADKESSFKKHKEDIDIYRYYKNVYKTKKDIVRENIFSDRLCRAEDDFRKLVTDVNKSIKSVIST